MKTREQALEALEVMRLELAKRPSGFSDQEAAERQEWANATALAVRSYLAQPEGGDVEDEIAYGHFEVKEEDGRHFWFGAEDGWKDSDEIGEDGVLTIDAKHFAVGTVLAMSEPVSASTSRSALRSAKEREAAAVGEWRTCDTCGKKAPPEFIEPDEGDIWMCHTCCWTWVSTNACYWENGRPLNGVDSAVAAAVERTVEKAKAIMRGYESVWIPEILAALDSLKETP